MRIKSVPPRVTNAPSVPEQQKPPDWSFALPPEVPSLMGALCAAWFTAGPPAEIATPAFPDRVGSACAVAVTLKFGGLGIALGELYKPDAVIVPNVVFGSPGGNPLTVQSTPVFAVPVTTASNCCCVPPTFSNTEMGETLTPIVIVTLAEALFVASACEIAVTVAAGGFGTILGAVKIPEALIVPKVAFPPVTPFTCHVTT